MSMGSHMASSLWRVNRDTTGSKGFGFLQTNNHDDFVNPFFWGGELASLSAKQVFAKSTSKFKVTHFYHNDILYRAKQSEQYCTVLHP